MWVGPGEGKRWYRPDLNNISRGRRSEPVVVYAERPPRQVRRLAAFDVAPEPTLGEFEVSLNEGETIRPDPVRLFRSRLGGIYAEIQVLPNAQLLAQRAHVPAQVGQHPQTISLGY